jgi:tetratricopeptide (TPR) repeat protein
MPLVPFLCLFAGATLEAAFAALRRRDPRRGAALAAGVALAALATTSPVRDRIEPGSHRGLGVLYERAGRVDEAAAQYRRALAKRAGFARAAEDLVCLELERGRFAEAAEAARLHLAARPENAHVKRLLEVAQGGAPPAEPFTCRRVWDVDPHQRSIDTP